MATGNIVKRGLNRASGFLRPSNARRSLENSPSALLADMYEQDEQRNENQLGTTGLIKQSIVALAITGLGLVTMGGAMMAASPQSTAVDQSAISDGNELPDLTRAQPLNAQIEVDPSDRKAIDERKQKKVDQEQIGLDAFKSSGESVSRNAIRSQLTKEVSEQSEKQRATKIDEQADDVAASVAEATRKERIEELDQDIARVKKEAARIAEEKRKAEEKIRKERERAAAAAAAAEQAKRAEQNNQADQSNQSKSSSSSNGGESTPSTSSGSSKSSKSGSSKKKSSGGNGGGGSTGGAVSGNGGAAPLARGTYSLGPSWRQYGSWSRWHTGQDFASPQGTPIYAVADGVVGGGNVGGWAGIHAVINHSGGSSTLYAHMSRKAVSPGQYVKAGQVIGYVGNTGRSFGAHLHFEYYPPGTLPGNVYSTGNPISFLLSLGVNV